MRVVEFSLRRRVTVAMCAVAVVLFGLVAFQRLPVSLLPDVAFPTMTVETRLDGAAPAEVESLVTRPVEEAVGIVTGVKRMSSVSQTGVSRVTLEFGWDRNVDFAAIDVRQKLDTARLPLEAARPLVLRYDPNDTPILRLFLHGSDDLYRLREVAEELVKKDLESTDGIGAVVLDGGYEEQIEVVFDDRRLLALGIDQATVGQRLERENVNRASGSLYESDARYLVRADNEFRNLDDLRDMIVARAASGGAIRLRDVATVERGHRTRQGITRLGADEAVQISLYREGDANTVLVARSVHARVARIRERLPAGLQLTAGVDQSRFIEDSIAEVISSALIGGLGATLVLLVFLRDLRSTLIVAGAIPLSVVATFLLMQQTGTSLNLMSLGGLALGVGMLVDNAIVVIEAVARQREAGASRLDAAMRGASEVGRAVAASTLTTIAVFVPVVFLEGIAAQLFRDMAVAVSFSLAMSLVVSLTLIPMLAAMGGNVGDRDHETAATSRWMRVLTWPIRMVRRIVRAAGRIAAAGFGPPVRGVLRALDGLLATYPPLLRAALRAKLVVIGSAVALTVYAVALVPRLGLDLLPNFSQGEFGVRIELAEGTPLERTDATVAAIAKVLDGDERVATYSSHAGRGDAQLDADAAGENVATIDVKLAAGTTRDDEADVSERLREALAAHGIERHTFTRATFFSFRHPIEIEIYGDDADALPVHAAAVASAMADVDGLLDVHASVELANPQLQLRFDRERLAALDLTVDDVATAIRTQLRGDVVSRLSRDSREIDIRVLARAGSRIGLDDIKDLIVARRDRRPVYLGTLVQTEVVAGPTEIRRIGQRRVALVQADVAGRDVASIADELRGIINGLGLPPEILAHVAGQDEELQRSSQSLRFGLALAVFLVYLVMASQFESLRHPLIVIVSLPLAGIGAVAGLFVTGRSIDVVAMIGMVMLAGIVVNNAIVLIDAVNQRRDGGEALHAALIDAASARLRPIVMTTATTVLGLLPMALGLGAGSELRTPLAITVIGGLVSASLLTLFVIPCVYELFGRAHRVASTPVQKDAP